MAGIKDFKKVSGATDDVAKLQERLQEFFVPIVANPLLDGLLLKDIVLGASPVKIQHKLRREMQGWIVVRKNAEADVWEPTRDLTKAYVTLQASADVTVDLWVF